MNMGRMLLLLCCCYHSAFAIENFALNLGQMTGNGWQAQEVKLQLNQLTETDFIFQLTIAQLQLPFLKTPLNQLSILCPHTYYTIEKIICIDGQLTFQHSILTDSSHLTFSYDLVHRQLDLTFAHPNFADGQIELSLQFNDQTWQSEINLRRINLAKINELISQPFTIEGNADLHLTAKQVDQTQEISIIGQITEGNFANSDFTQATENLAIAIELQAVHTNEIWQIQSDLSIQQGGIYSEPIYASFDTLPAHLMVDLTYQNNQLTIQNLLYQQQEAIDLQVSGVVDLVPTFTIENLAIQAKSEQLRALRDTYLASWLETKAFKALTMQGKAEMQLNWNTKDIQVSTQLHHVNLTDENLHLGLLDINGTLQWHNQAAHLPSQLSWSSGYVATAIPLGAGQLAIELSSEHITLLQPLNLPILDGRLRIDSFTLNHINQPDMQGMLKGSVSPISLNQLMTSLQLTAMEGIIAVNLPTIHYKNQQITTDGPIVLDIFDGYINIDQLRIQKPLANPTILTSEINVQQLNLAKLTHVTKFGEIQGELSGFIHHLQLVNWQPIAFNAYFATPENSVLPRTISQKAIDNLTSLGGSGTVDTLSRAVLSVFEQFSYQKLGAGCRLKKGICYIQGIEQQGDGYYIVKGGGLPRIDMVGYNQQVDWQILLTRLKRVTNLQSPVIQ